MSTIAEIRAAKNEYADAVESGDLVARIAASIRLDALLAAAEEAEVVAAPVHVFAPTDGDTTRFLTMRALDQHLSCDCGSATDCFKRALDAARETVAYMNTFLTPDQEVIR